MIYRIVVDHRYHTWSIDGRMLAASWRDSGYPEAERLRGAGYGFLADVMNGRRLEPPEITNPRARFYFTEAGWHQVGRHVAARARRIGHVVRVIRRKNPHESQVVYRDQMQVAILPRKFKDASR